MEEEYLAIKLGIQAFQVYFLGKPFTMHTENTRVVGAFEANKLLLEFSFATLQVSSFVIELENQTQMLMVSPTLQQLFVIIQCHFSVSTCCDVADICEYNKSVHLCYRVRVEFGSY